MSEQLIDKLAWIHIVDGQILSTRNRGKDTFYIPGGKREQGESDVAALSREILEELSVTLIDTSITFVGAFEAEAHGKSAGVTVRMTCYTADYEGTLSPASEIDEIRWLDYSGREISSAVDKVIFDWLHDRGDL